MTRQPRGPLTGVRILNLTHGFAGLGLTPEEQRKRRRDGEKPPAW